MTVIVTDGFDMYNGLGSTTGLTNKWTSNGGSSVALTTGRFAGQGVNMGSSGSGAGRITRTFTGSPVTSVGVGVAINVTAMPTTDTVHGFLSILKGVVTTFGLRITTTGALEAYRLTSLTAGTSLGVSAGSVIGVGWHFIECAVTISDTVGTVLVKVDGSTVLNLSSQDTNNAVTNVDSISFGFGANNPGTLAIVVDDLYITDGATLGERKIETLRPAADTATKNWTPLTGTANYAMVNETLADGDTSYVQASTVGTRDLYTLGTLSSTPTVIDAIQIVSFMEKTDATTRTVYNSCQSAGTDSDGSAFSLTASYNRFDRLLATDPNGGGSWTASRVNGLLIGPKIAS
jgi:hypothetical protein